MRGLHILHLCLVCRSFVSCARVGSNSSADADAVGESHASAAAGMLLRDRYVLTEFVERFHGTKRLGFGKKKGTRVLEASRNVPTWQRFPY